MLIMETSSAPHALVQYKQIKDIKPQAAFTASIRSFTALNLEVIRDEQVQKKQGKVEKAGS